MKSKFSVVAIPSSGSSNSAEGMLRPSTAEPSFADYIEQAEICCEQARLAARCRRYKAACGLFDTASALYQQAMALDSISYPALENRVRDVAVEKMAYAELARSLSRPLLKR